MAGVEGSEANQDLLLPFEVNDHAFALAYPEVARVTLPSAVLALPFSAGPPAFVAGVASSGADIVTVLDGGLLLGSARIEPTLKTRLIVFSDGEMKGFGLLVARVLDVVPSNQADHVGDLKRLASADLAAMVSAGGSQQHS